MARCATRPASGADRTRYLIRRGRRLMEGGYRDLLAGRPGRSPA